MTAPPSGRRGRPRSSTAAPYDAFLLVSFGGPERPEDVLPFLANVTRGRDVPPQRLAAVAEHYFAAGGASPINAQNRALVAALAADFAHHGVELAVYWGNRNWSPYLADTMDQIVRDGHRRVLTLLTSAYSSYSGCRQYREDLAAALAPLGDRAPHVDRIRHYFNHPGFVDPMVAHTVTALDQLAGSGGTHSTGSIGSTGSTASTADGSDAAAARLVFVTHSVPTAMNERSGPHGGAYEAQHRDVASTVTAGVAAATGRRHAYDLVFCSRSGPPDQPWLEPDVNDHLRALHGEGVPGVVLVPIGFVSDHMEVVHDLDTEAMATAAELGLPCVRASTVGTDPRFVAAVRQLVLERSAVVRGEAPVRPALGALGPSHDICPAGCCPNLGDPHRPAVCGAGD